MSDQRQRTGHTMNSHYIKSYYERNPGKRQENRLKDAIRLIQKNGYIVLPPVGSVDLFDCSDEPAPAAGSSCYCITQRIRNQ